MRTGGRYKEIDGKVELVEAPTMTKAEKAAKDATEKAAKAKKSQTKKG